MESQSSVDLTGRSLAVLEYGVAHDPKLQREVNEDIDDEDDDEETDDEPEDEDDNEETDDEPEDEELQQLILENKRLNEEASELFNLLDKERDKQIENLGKKIKERAEFTNRLQERIDKKAEEAKLLFSGTGFK